MSPFAVTIAHGTVSRASIKRPGSAFDDRGQAGLEVLFDGRLDNRCQLLGDLRQSNIGGTGVSDARLALLAYRKWGRRCCERLLGPFAMIVLDPERRRLLAGRDPLGDRTLYYHLDGHELVIATEASAVLRHPSVTSRLDKVTLSRFFAVEAPATGATFFADIRELPPGHTLLFDDGRTELACFWPPTEMPEVRYRNDDEYIEHFRSLLVESVRCRLRSSSTPAVLMSGGLDSTSVAALAAGELAARNPGDRLPVVSWVFDELPGADERAFMDPVIKRFSLSPQRIHGDGDWPLRDLESWPSNPDAPGQGLYCRLQNKAYAAAVRAGATVMLTGEFGDHLYQDAASWLRALLAEGRWAESWWELRKELGDRSLWTLARGGPARGAVARAIGYRRRRPVKSWLTPVGRRLAGPESRAQRLPGVLDPRCAHAASLEASNARQAGIDIRRPFRDRRLIEFVLSIPAHLLYRPGWSKWILRRAMEGILPERVRLRRHVSSLLPLAARGLAERELDTVRGLLAAPEAVWRRYVRPDWLAAAFPHSLRLGLDGIEAAVPWQCLCSEIWTRRTGFSEQREKG